MIKLYVCEISNLIEEVKADENALQTYFDKLGRGRIEHILKNCKAEDRARALGASLLLLFALNNNGYEMEKLPEFSFMENGKPYFAEHPELFFNLSHSGNYVLCVLGDCEMGADIEQVRSIKGNTKNRVFTEKEKVMTLGNGAGYIRLWTMKEACAKLQGTGLKEILSGLEIFVEDDKVKIKKLNQNITKAFHCVVSAEGKITDCSEVVYYYSVCTHEDTLVESIFAKWGNHTITLS